MGFTAAQAARLTGCTLAQLSSWERSGLVAPPPGPAHRYRFQDLVALGVVASLLDAGLSLDLIRGAVGELVHGGDDDPPHSLVTDGGTVWVCRDDRQVLDALRHGPVACVIAVDRIGRDVDAAVRAFDAERQSFVQGLRDAEGGGPQPPPSDEQAPPGGEAGSGRAGGASARGRSRPHATQR
ncbi:MAG TPA: helix-turn-helix domain-containing protein [Acidimicrobiia bacterium]|nr:helix-turn-helix domain-containing protein [Acidimicrobiia bacterium]